MTLCCKTQRFFFSLSQNALISGFVEVFALHVNVFYLIFSCHQFKECDSIVVIWCVFSSLTPCVKREGGGTVHDFVFRHWISDMAFWFLILIILNSYNLVHMPVGYIYTALNKPLICTVLLESCQRMIHNLPKKPPLNCCCSYEVLPLLFMSAHCSCNITIF